MVKIRDYAAFEKRFGTDREKMKKAFDFLAKDLSIFECGRYEIDEDCFVNISEYEPKDVEPVFEAHEKYIDIQKIVSGKEIIKVAKLRDCTVKTPYVAEKDVAFYTSQSYDTFIMEEGDCMVLYPEDAHAPGLKTAGSTKVKKAVVKLKV